MTAGTVTAADTGVALGAEAGSVAVTTPPQGLRAERGGVNWNAVTALAALMTSFAAVGVCVMLAVTLRSEGERQRFTASLDTAWRLDTDWTSPAMASTRSAAASALLAGRPAPEIETVLDFFDEIAFLLEREAIDEELAWYEFSRPMIHYWYASERYILRERRSGPPPWEKLAMVIPRLLQIDARQRRRSVDDSTPGAAEIRDFLNSEIDAGMCEDNPEAEVRRLPS